VIKTITATTIASIFRDIYEVDAEMIVRSPGRINLIGEHTDYNNGFVLPAAIDKDARFAISRRNDNEIHLFAVDYEESHVTNLSELSAASHTWAAYILGVVQQLQQNGYAMKGFNAALSSTIPAGAGMSSSAAIECAVIFALNELFDCRIDKLDMVKMAQKAENEFVGVKCGIMDMFASMYGKKGYAMKLDCRSLHFDYFPIALRDSKIVLFDTGVKHSLASGEYNTRRNECEQGVAALQQIYPQVRSLRDANARMVSTVLAGKVADTVLKRCTYVVDEIARVQEGCEDLKKDDIAAFGKKMYRTHEGLSKLFEVSCAESDFLVEFVKNEKSVAGARMMGGGFGGCTINIVQEDAIDDLYERIKTAYGEAYGIDLKMYVTSPQEGTSVVERN
jgi:galactokinase